MLLSPTLDADRQRPLAMLGGVAVATGLVLTATGDDGLVLCPYRVCTGGYCPGCGGTRAARQLLGGDIAGAWHHHPWVVLAAAQLLILGGIVLLTRSRVPTIEWRRWLLPLTVVNVVAMLAIWVVRLADGSVPTGWL